MREIFSEGVTCPCDKCLLRNEDTGICDTCPELQEYLDVKAHDEEALICE